MKNLSRILIITVLTLGSCTASKYTGGEYDDLYYSSSDNNAQSAPAEKGKVSNNVQDDTYFNNIYAADTLVSEQYSEAVDYNNQSATVLITVRDMIIMIIPPTRAD